MAPPVGKFRLDPGQGSYEEEMPEHLLKMAMDYLEHYCLVRGYKQITLTIGPHRKATIWGDDVFKSIRTRLTRIEALAERGTGEWGQESQS